MSPAGTLAPEEAKRLDGRRLTYGIGTRRPTGRRGAIGPTPSSAHATRPKSDEQLAFGRGHLGDLLHYFIRTNAQQLEQFVAGPCSVHGVSRTEEQAHPWRIDPVLHCMYTQHCL
jgi:hypothetical protein